VTLQPKLGLARAPAFTGVAAIGIHRDSKLSSEETLEATESGRHFSQVPAQREVQ
jgi:hypothetical protein